jgi:hypothetical protein
VSGARTRRAKRLAAIFPIVEELAAHGEEIDGSWMTRRNSRQFWFHLSTPISRNGRGGDALVDSNFYTAEKIIDAVSPWGITHRSDLWPGGSIETLVIRADDAFALRELTSIVNWLTNGYPVLDEADYSQREWEENHPQEGECYSEYDCCTKCDECGFAISESAERQKTDHFYNCDQHPE